MSGLIVYKSKYGSTKCYAEWISERLNYPVISVEEYSQQNSGMLENLENIVFGSPIYGGKLLLSKWMKNNWEAFAGKKKYLFILGSISSDKQDKIASIIHNNFSENYLKELKYFYFLGRARINELNIIDKIILKVASILFAKDEASKKMLTKGFDLIKKENINLLVDEIINNANQ